jgi:predicted RNA binding protein YcfA (HicA-like mRNA interferase family)
MYKLLSSKKIIKTLMKHGFVEVSQKGSHVKYKNKNRIVIVPHPKKEIPRGTLASILRQSGLQKEDFLIDN